MVAILLDPYSPGWPAVFSCEAQRIESALHGLDIETHHAGSTAVPGLRAKPVIDIVLAVADSRDEPAYLPALVAAGYEFVLREREWFEHRLFKRTEPRVNLHVFTSGSAEVERMLVFRDHLRQNAEDRELYESTKAALAEREWSTVQDYADAKSEVVVAITNKAMATRHPSPSQR